MQYSSAPFTCTAVYDLSKSFIIVGICVHYLCFVLRENFVGNFLESIQQEGWRDEIFM